MQHDADAKPVERLDGAADKVFMISSVKIHVLRSSWICENYINVSAT